MLNLIVAVSKNGVIGNNNQLIWRISEDLKVFKHLTMDGVLFVGRKTNETLPPLKNREVIELKRNQFPSLTDIPSILETKQKTGWIIGGGEIYKSALKLNLCDRLYVSIIDQEYEGDTYFDAATIDPAHYTLVSMAILRKADPLVSQQIWEKNK